MMVNRGLQSPDAGSTSCLCEHLSFPKSGKLCDSIHAAQVEPVLLEAVCRVPSLESMAWQRRVSMQQLAVPARLTDLGGILRGVLSRRCLEGVGVVRGVGLWGSAIAVRGGLGGAEGQATHLRAMHLQSVHKHVTTLTALWAKSSPRNPEDQDRFPCRRDA